MIKLLTRMEANKVKVKQSQNINECQIVKERQKVNKSRMVKVYQKVKEGQRRVYPSARLPKCGLIRINGAIYVYASCESCESCIGYKS